MQQTVPSSKSESAEFRILRLLLPVTRIRLLLLLLHHGGRYRRRWTWDPHARTGVDYRDCVARAQGRRLVELHLLAVVRLEASDGVVGVVRRSGG